MPQPPTNFFYDYTPVGILCSGGHSENRAMPHWCWVSDLCPFGSIKPATSWIADSMGYRYGFNSQERDDEISGKGNSYTAEYWQYDARLGRRWNVDPIDQISVSNYACFKNNPLIFLDIVGDSTVYYTESGKLLFTSHDNMQNAVVIIKDKDVQRFVELGTEYMKVGQSHTDNANIVGRMMGTEYVLDDFYNWLDNEQKGEWLTNQDGSRTGWRAEKGSMLFDDNGRISIGSRVAVANDPKDAYKKFYWDIYYGDFDEGSVSKVHSHSNVGMSSSIAGTATSGRSPFDSKTHNTPKCYMDVAVEKNQDNEYKLILYNKGTGDPGFIEINKDTFKK